MQVHRIVREKRNAGAVAKRIRRGLIAYNAAKVGKPAYRRLMYRAETVARRAGKRLIYLNTYSFQAPGFYRKLGFRSFG